jgi:hypothetical protein
MQRLSPASLFEFSQDASMDAIAKVLHGTGIVPQDDGRIVVRELATGLCVNADQA